MVNKMIVVQSPLKRDFIKELLTSNTHEGFDFKFESEKGMKLYFSVDSEEKELASKVAKKVIKESEVGAALYFNVSYE